MTDSTSPEQRTFNPPVAEQPLTLQLRAADALATIRRGWPLVLDPIRTTSTSSGTSDTPRAATEDERDQQQAFDPRTDTARQLAFWVHALVDEWPSALQHLETGPDGKLIVVTDTIDCTDVPAMATLLAAEADRLATWQEAGHDYGETFVEDVEQIAAAVKRVAWPPKGDRITIGTCPSCGRRVRVKAPRWLKRPVRVPNPTTDPETYPEWDWWVPDDAPFEPERDRPITCRCGLEHTLQEWHQRMVAFEDREPKTATELVVLLADAGHARYKTPAIVRQWARQGLIVKVGTSGKGESLYDPVQVLAALVAREKRREREAS